MDVLFVGMFLLGMKQTTYIQLNSNVGAKLSTIRGSKYDLECSDAHPYVTHPYGSVSEHSISQSRVVDTL